MMRKILGVVAATLLAMSIAAQVSPVAQAATVTYHRYTNPAGENGHCLTALSDGWLATMRCGQTGGGLADWNQQWDWVDGEFTGVLLRNRLYPGKCLAMDYAHELIPFMQVCRSNYQAQHWTRYNDGWRNLYFGTDYGCLQLNSVGEVSAGWCGLDFTFWGDTVVATV